MCGTTIALLHLLVILYNFQLYRRASLVPALVVSASFDERLITRCEHWTDSPQRESVAHTLVTRVARTLESKTSMIRCESGRV